MTKFTAPPGALAAAVKFTARWVAAKPAVPIWAGILFDVADGTVRLTAFNETTTAHADVKVDGDESGRFVVSGRLIAALVDTFPDKAVTFETHDALVKVSAGRWAGTLPTMSPEDFPGQPPEPAIVGTVPGDVFADAIRRVGTAASQDEASGLTMVGIFMRVEADDDDAALRLIATDRYRAATMLVPFDVDDADDPVLRLDVLVLASTLIDAADGFDGIEPVRIGLDNHSFGLATSTRTLITRQIAGAYPLASTKAFEEEPGARFAEVRAKDLVVPLRRAAIVQGKRDAPPSARLDFTEGLLTLSTVADGEVLSEGAEEVDVTYEGDPVSALIRSNLLQAGLNAAPSDTVTMSIVPGGPLSRRPVRLASAADPNWRYIVMPLTHAGGAK